LAHLVAGFELPNQSLLCFYDLRVFGQIDFYEIHVYPEVKFELEVVADMFERVRFSNTKEKKFKK